MGSRYWQVWFLLRPLSLLCRWLSSPWSAQGHLSVPMSSFWVSAIQMTLFYLNYLLKAPVSKYSHILTVLGVRTWTCEFGGKMQSAHNTKHQIAHAFFNICELILLYVQEYFIESFLFHWPISLSMYRWHSFIIVA